MFCKKDLRNFPKFTGKHLHQGLFLIKLQAEACNFIKKRDSGTGVFPVNFAKFLRIPFFKEHFSWLLLNSFGTRLGFFIFRFILNIIAFNIQWRCLFVFFFLIGLFLFWWFYGKHKGIFLKISSYLYSILTIKFDEFRTNKSISTSPWSQLSNFY